ncbi:hypothetical protein BEP19_08885 [Ammoniphilus oxalaticus]|uniref:HTH tetR-type domain-containing protein n=1 Tax=Ammoniphilus oxalaticus TaxID=66863 RepID=A0A419SKL3_9BACL|nr:TetR/AcrR family transcriptional regulator [Ammoniphilus oxalaticus]RKD24489.1 hypothetical protein BEP19_08885 [Ammoniphilus oxalaticus]
MARSTQDLIYYGAIEAFSGKGFSETTMDDIAEQAGVAKGTLYYNFKNKEALFSYVMRRGIEKLTEEIGEAIERAAGEPSKWAKIVAAQLDYFEEHRSFFRLLMQNVWGPANLSGQLTPQELLKDYFRKLDEALADDQFRSVIDSELDVQTVSGALFGMVTMPAFRAVLRDQQINEPARVTSITHIVLRSLQRGETN